MMTIGMREKRATETKPSPFRPRRGFPTIAIRWTRAFGGGGVNRRSDRRGRPALAFPSVANQ